MNATEQAAVAAALSRHRILGQLEDALRADMLTRMDLRRYAAQELVADGLGLKKRMGLVIEGRIALRPEPQDEAIHLEADEWFGTGVQPADTLPGWQVTAEAPTQIAFIAAADLGALCEAYPRLRLFVDAPPSAPAEAADPHMNLMRTPVRSLLKRAPITVTPATTIRAAAELMRELRVSSVLVVEDGHLFGLVTDRDLRNRALAAGLDTGRPVIDIATVAPLKMDISGTGFDALLLMARHNIHHVPVLDGQQVAGMITATDVTEQHTSSAVYLVGDIHKQSTLDDLVAAAGKVKALQKHLSAAGASAYATGHIITAVTDALTTRLLQLGELKLGPAPVDFAWVAAGSQARNEQTAKSDQDNCMILDDAYDEAQHGAYFKALSTFVCDGLNACGYVHCPGKMMAMTDQWRQPRRVWADYFRRWVDTPEPMALMLTCVFFDVRTVAGRSSLLEDLRADVLRRTKGNRLFLAHMVNNALSRQPPLGLFGGLSMIRSGEHKGKIDLKHTGIVPVIDLARVYALASGHDAINTHDRLAHAADSGEISPPSVHDLRDALEFLSLLRIRHQARQIAAGHAADNYLKPDDLSNFERSQLKDAFNVVKQLQEVLAQRYQATRY